MAWSANEALEDILGSGSDGDSYAGDESNAMNECDTDLESEPGDLEEDDEQPTEESPPEQSDKQPKRRRTDTSPVASSSNVVRYHGCGQVASRGQKSPRAGLSLSAGHTPVLRKSVPTQPRALNVGAKRGFDDKETLSAALGNITNMLGSVIERLDKTESKLESMERKLNSPSSSSSGSGADAKRKVPTIVRVSYIIVCVCVCVLPLCVQSMCSVNCTSFICRQRPEKCIRPCLMVTNSLDLIFLLSKQNLT